MKLSNIALYIRPCSNVTKSNLMHLTHCKIITTNSSSIQKWCLKSKVVYLESQSTHNISRFPANNETRQNIGQIHLTNNSASTIFKNEIAISFNLNKFYSDLEKQSWINFDRKPFWNAIKCLQKHAFESHPTKEHSISHTFCIPN